MVATIPKIQPTLIQTFYHDLTDDERGEVLAALERELDARNVSGLWRNFQCNQAVALLFRTETGRIAAVSFYELRRNDVGDLQFFVRGGVRVQPTIHATDVAFPQFEQFARYFNCREMAFQTSRPGLVTKVVERMEGWSLDPILEAGEFVVRKELR